MESEQIGKTESIYLHVVFDEKLGRAQHVHEIGPDQLEGGFALERSIRIIEADVQRVPLRRAGIVLLLLLLLLLGDMDTTWTGSCRHRSKPSLVKLPSGQDLAEIGQ